MTVGTAPNRIPVHHARTGCLVGHFDATRGRAHETGPDRLAIATRNQALVTALIQPAPNGGTRLAVLRAGDLWGAPGFEPA